jgi:biotin transport system substrate-specific component
VLVAAGRPRLGGGRGGLGYFFSPPAGFGLSWPFAAAVIGALISRGKPTLVWSLMAIAIGGIGVSYGIGVAWLALVAHLPFQKALLGTLAFLPGDAVKVVIAALVADNVRRAYPHATRG